MKPTKYQKAAGVIRARIADGTLPPGAAAPSGAALARVTGYSVLTCRRALRLLIADGALVPGTSPNARPRVPGAQGDQSLEEARRALSGALARRRRAAGLTQPQFARLIGLSVTTIGHAETGRTWQSRTFWEHADKLLDAGGELLRLRDAHQAAASAGPAARTREPPHRPGPAQAPATFAVDLPAAVAHVTITWTNGLETTVVPSSVSGLSPFRHLRPPRAGQAAAAFLAVPPWSAFA